MYKFTQYIPPMVDYRSEPASFVFETEEEMTSELSKLGYGLSKCRVFSHYAVIDNLLMEVSDEGFYWWVVGTASPVPTWLPKWEAKYREFKTEYKPENVVVILNGVVLQECIVGRIVVERTD